MTRDNLNGMDDIDADTDNNDATAQLHYLSWPLAKPTKIQHQKEMVQWHPWLTAYQLPLDNWIMI